MNVAVWIALILFVSWSILALTQLWLNWLDGLIFFKLTLTAGVLIVVSLLVGLAAREYLSDKDLKAKGYLDD